MGYNKGWLDYKQIEGTKEITDIKRIVVSCHRDSLIENAVKELKEFFLKGFGIELEVVEGSKSLFTDIVLELKEGALVTGEGFWVHKKEDGIFITASTSVGVLYGVFRFIGQIRIHNSFEKEIKESPSNPLRMLNHWDNMDGSIERGYAGNSIFFEENEILVNKRTAWYARLCASVGINGVSINNVNVKDSATFLITDKYMDKLVQIGDIFKGYGIKLFLSINFAAPVEMGELHTADPLDEGVLQWWKDKTKKLYERIPDFGGYIVKADSEFRPGPFTYNRTHSDGANMLARALAPFGGLLIWRCFVYNCRQDWRDKKTDRARAAYDHFMGLDGSFDENVILQIKNGPMDFQVREPVSPLIGGLRKTNQLLEFQITQEYTGQQKHVCFLVPMWKEVLEFNMEGDKETETVSQIIAGKAYPMIHSGITAVSNIGNDYNWTGHDLAACNWYGYGRLIFNTDLSAKEIAREWTVLTFGKEERVVDTILSILLSSWPAYEKYTSPLGIGWMVNPNHHYGPNIDGYEYSKWGTYHRADCKGMGVDRTNRGTGYAMQYKEPVASLYNNMDTCPEELLLFFHYVPYTHMLKSGKTLIQHIYDSHFEGVLDVESMIAKWKALEGLIGEDVYQRVLDRLFIQLESSIEWRDMVNTYFYRKSGIKDEYNREICE